MILVDCNVLWEGDGQLERSIDRKKGSYGNAVPQ